MFKFKREITGETGNGGTKNAEIMIPLKYLSNLLRTPEMPLINWEINLLLTCSEKCVLSNHTKATTFAMTDTKLYVPVVQDNAKQLQQLKSGFKRTITWNKCQSKVSIQAPNPHRLLS